MDATWPPSLDASEARSGIEERLVEMIRIPTISASISETGLGAFAEFTALLTTQYPLLHRDLELERIGELGLVFRWTPTEPSPAAPVVLMAHYDVVPVAGQEAEWGVPPFEGRIENGEVWGRGALDDKGALCTLLEAVENLLAQGWTPPREVLLCLGGDEEDHGHAAREIAETLKERGVRPSFVLDEGGAISEVPFPGVTGWFAMVGLAEKGVMTVRLSTTGEGGHASAPTGLTAVGRVARAVARLNRNPFAVRMPKTVQALFAAIAAVAQPQYASLYRLAAKVPALTARLLPLAGADGEVMVRTSLAATMLAGGSSSNVLPSHASAMLNIRMNVGESSAGVVARLAKVIADPQVSIEIVEADEPTAESGVDNSAWAQLRAAVDAAYPGVATLPYLTTAATDGRHWHRFTPDVYRFAPLAMDTAQRAGIHGVNERVSIDSLRRGERFYRALLLGLPAGGDRNE
jgi:carboxypeptidase PM20D1